MNRVTVVSAAGLAMGASLLLVAVSRGIEIDAAAASADDSQKEASREASFLQAELVKHEGPVLKTAFSPDGKWLASAGHDGKLIVWRTKDWKPVATLETDGRHLWCVTFSPNGRVLAAAGGDRIGVWAVGSRWKKLTEVQVPGPQMTQAGMMAEATIFDLVFSPNSRLLAAATENTKVQLWETRKWTELPGLEGHVFPKSMRPTGRPDNIIDTPMVEFVDFSPDGRRLVSGGKVSAVRVWSFVGKKWHGSKIFEETILAHRMWARFSPDGKQLAVGGTDGKLDVFKGKKLKKVKSIQVYPNSFVSGFEFTHDGKHVVVAGDDLRVFETSSWKEVARYDPGEPVTFVAISPDDTYVVTAGRQSELRVHSLAKIRVGE